MSHISKKAEKEIKELAGKRGYLFHTTPFGEIARGMVIDSRLDLHNYEDWSMFYSSEEDSFYRIVDGELIEANYEPKKYLVVYRNGEISDVVEARSSYEAHSKFREKYNDELGFRCNENSWLPSTVAYRVD